MIIGTVPQVVGQTPLIKIKSLSELSGCQIFGKAEFMNPGGSVKDRAAKGILEKALSEGQLSHGGEFIEGTAGNTGIGLATVAKSYGLKPVIVMPDNQSSEKYETLRALGVELITVPPCPFANPNHFYHTAARIAAERNIFWCNQFENTANFEMHFNSTGPEIWQQTENKVDAFIAASGTGGTIGGVSQFLKSQNKNIFVGLADPKGSGLFNYFKSGQMTSDGSSITEGIGIMRITENYRQARIDDAYQITDQQMLNMLYHLAHFDGLLVGTSAALNCVAAFQHAMAHKDSDKIIVTILCDSALRYSSKIFNSEFLSSKGLIVPKNPVYSDIVS